MQSRRSVLAALGTSGALAICPKLASGSTATHGPWINGNLVVPIDTDRALDPATVRMIRAAGLTAAKLTLGGPGTSDFAATMEEIGWIDKAILLNPTVYRRVRSARDLKPDPGGRLGIIYSFEAGEMLEGKIENIDAFRARGVRVMGLSYNLPTPFASGVMAKQSTGLTELGRMAIARMNAVGVTLDVSHSDERSSLAAVASSRMPALITHAGCAAIRPHPRNKSDVLLRALSDRGGVVGIYELSYLTERRQPTIETYMAHLTHALNVCGEDHVGIGSDTAITPFDTSPESLREWAKQIAERKAKGVAAPGEGPPPFVVGLNRADRFNLLNTELRKRRLSGRIVDKILGGNFRRVFGETWSSD